MKNQSNRYKHLFVIILALAGVTSLIALPSYSSRVTVKVTAQSVCVTPPSGMVSWWPGDGNANDIQGSNSGTLQGGATFAPGMVGQGFSLNGTSAYVSIPDSPSVSITGQISIDAWIKPNSVSGPSAQAIVSKYNTACPSLGTEQRSYVFIVLPGGRLRFCVYSGGSDQYHCVDTTNPIAANVFTHVAATFNPATQGTKIYVNGVEVPASLAPGSVTVNPIFDSNTPVEIGRIFCATDHNYFAGLIDEVELFNRELTASEIASIVHADSAGKCKNRPPVAVCQNVTVSAGASCTASASINNGSSDPDGDPITITQSPAGPYPLGTTTVTLTVTDNKGASSQCIATVTVVDNTPPSITAPPAVTASTGPGATACGVTISDATLGSATASDNCGSTTITRSGVPTGNFFPVGTTTITYTAKDASGNTATATQSVTVNDTTPPTPDLATLPDVTGQCSATISTAPTATDYCKGKITGTTTDPLTYTSQGTFIVTWTFDDGNGNKSTQTQKVIVKDTTPPVPDVAALPDVTGQCSATIGSAPTATDNCKGKIIGTTTDPLTYSSQGTFTVTWTFDDGNGNKSTQTQKVIVKDTTPPVMTLNGASSLTVECHTSFTDPGATASDNCAGNLTSSITVTGSVNANAVGSYTLTYKVSDPAGNPASATRTVNVVDTAPPVITLVGANPLTVECHTGFADPGATASDACAGSLPVTLSGSVNPNAPGTYTITYTATDPSGNLATATRTVKVVDTTPPTITISGANPMTVECHTGFTDPGATATDACAGSVPVTPAGSVNVNTPGTYTITYSATDPSGNTATATRTVQVVDTTPPVITLTGPNPLTVECHSSFTDPGATASDTCAGSVPVTVSGSVDVNTPGTYTLTYSASDGTNTATATRTVKVVDTTPPVITLAGANPLTVECHSSFTDPGATANDACAGPVAVTASGSVNVNAVGSYTITYFATDGANTATKTRTVNVVDTTPPVITLNGANPMTIECHSSFADPGATASDVCVGNLTSAITVSGTVNANAVGSYTLTYSVSDGANTATATRTVKVVDTTPPSITAPSAVNASTGAGATACGVVISEATLGTALASDNCSGVALTRSGVPAGNFFAIGTTTLTYTATDANSNTATATQLVTVIDNTPPVLTCPANISVAGNLPGSCSASLNPGTATATDNCAGATVTGTRNDGQALNAPYPLGTTTITWTATDAAGNRAACQQSVTVTNPSPVVTITGPLTGSVYAVNTPVTFTGTFTDNPGGTHTATWSFDALTQTGTVNEATSAVSATYAFTTAGVYQVTLTVNDGCGGTGTASTVDGLTALVVVYDPNGGFVTGGGWINSPAGAYVANPSLTGKANFGFVSKYEPGANVPTGQTEFQFKVANLNFHSTSYEWLVVAGARAQYKGTGTINGGGNYGFLLTAIDGQVSGGGGVDKFRIKIWDKNNGDAIVYDNQVGAGDDATPTTVLGGGSIVIHK